MKDATPDRYVVDRRGTPDPVDSEYFVIDVVHDVVGRALLWLLVRWYRNRASREGLSTRADELQALLDRTNEASTRVIEAMQMPTKKKVGRPKSARPR